MRIDGKNGSIPVPDELWWDGHVHSTRSDGRNRPDQVAQLAKALGLGAVALSDHNCLDTALARDLSARYGIAVLSACEFSAAVRLRGDSRDREVHVIGLFLEETDDIRQVLRTNQQDRRRYVMAYLEALDRLGLDMSGDGSHDPELAYDRLRAENQDSGHLGRAAIAWRMVELGYAASTEEAFRKYLGRNAGDERRIDLRAEEFLHYASLEEVLAAIRSCPGALSVLCHPYLGLDPEQPGSLEELVRRFAALGGDAMEVFYGTGSRAYTPGRQARLLELCQAHRLLPSAGSDHHGDDTPMLRGDPRLYRALCRRHEELLREGR